MSESAAAVTGRAPGAPPGSVWKPEDGVRVEKHLRYRGFVILVA